MYELKTEFLFNANYIVAPVSETIFIGDGGWGERVIGQVAGGSVEGPKIKGIAKPFGADWLLIRHDGVWVVDVRLVIETDDGALIHVTYPGIVDISVEEGNQMLSGVPLEKKFGIHTTPRFETGHENYLWMNKIMSVATGEVMTVGDHSELNYSVYAIR